jgi:lipopolysaccharide transport system ATP-binding protein
MADLAICVKELGKRYTIGEGQAGYRTLRDSIVETLIRPFGKARKLLSGNRTGSEQNNASIWALKDVSFEIKHGEVVGIIGRNGAGKSTLLKILSQITEPTEGGVDLYGRVGSLLEVGTGFHPELTGRENIYLSGAILGMKRAEIERKFDDIVSFAEVEKFLHTPVKHYSSGMYLRLAFAVAAHLEPDILIVDEVLAVGDAAFQKKCMGKMTGVAKEGRTVLFVSHNMAAVTRLCERAILLDGGRVLEDGPAGQVVTTYLTSGVGKTMVRNWDDLAKAPGSDVVRLCGVRSRAEDGQITESVDIRRPVGIEIEYEVLKSGYIFHPAFSVHNSEGVLLFAAQDTDTTWMRRPRPKGRYVSTGWISGNLLCEGAMSVGVSIWTLSPEKCHMYEQDAVIFHVVDTFEDDSARGAWRMSIPGIVRPKFKWGTQFYGEQHEPLEVRHKMDLSVVSGMQPNEGSLNEGK